MGQYLSSFIYKQHAVHQQIEGNSLRNPEMAARKVSPKKVFGRLPTSMESPRNMEWTFKPLVRDNDKLLQSPIQKPEQRLGKKSKKRKRTWKKDIAPNASKNFQHIH